MTEKLVKNQTMRPFIYSATRENPTPEFEYEVLELEDVVLIAKVILYNDELHTFEEVSEQLVKAIQCNYEQAEALTFEVHTRGKAMVYEGNIEDCLKVSGILQEIALLTEIQC
jgi:ATP-dependent Clp protease adaptor protein ClpS